MTESRRHAPVDQLADLHGDLAGTHHLPPRQRQVLELLLEGLADKEIAERLGISRHTVNQYTKQIYRRFGVTSRAVLMARLPGGERLTPQSQGLLHRHAMSKVTACHKSLIESSLSIVQSPTQRHPTYLREARGGTLRRY